MIDWFSDVYDVNVILNSTYANWTCYNNTVLLTYYFTGNILYDPLYETLVQRLSISHTNALVQRKFLSSSRDNNMLEQYITLLLISKDETLRRTYDIYQGDPIYITNGTIPDIGNTNISNNNNDSDMTSSNRLG